MNPPFESDLLGLEMTIDVKSRLQVFFVLGPNYFIYLGGVKRIGAVKVTAMVCLISVSLVLIRDTTPGGSYQNRALQQMLVELDGISSNDDIVCVLAATNRPELLDRASRGKFCM